jgi:glycerol dehydrogenase
VIADDFVMKLAGDKVLNGLHSHNISCHAERFNGECSHAEINRLIAILKQHGCRGVVGIGGGKTSIPRRRSAITRSCRWW